MSASSHPDMSDVRDLFSLKGKKVWVPGHKGMVGSALVRRLSSEDCEILETGRQQVNLVNQEEVFSYLDRQKPDAVFLAAAKVGGIHANNTYPADFIHDNLAISLNVIDSAYKTGVEKLLFLGSSCIYPRMAPQPMTEDALLTGPLEPTNEWYAIAKIAGLKMCEAYFRQHGANFISAMPTNLYGVGDNFDLENSHVLPALMRKLHDAKTSGAEEVVMWGTGTPKREFLHVDDLADALVYLMKNYRASQTINVGTGDEVTIAELGQLVAEAVGYEGKFVQDTSKPDGTPRKLLDVSRLNALGWTPNIPLKEGIKDTYQWFLDQMEKEKEDLRL